ncbi:1853_t:CDS:2 [Funneliformis geosporum]|uniref:1853_t:CDS:1 n=1 Tax=Funneliformis geosporum TaxID=1117311 RepID=A0A9W4SHH0_9GLOM|nr:1853_t:CDS:2 [Funneliformis geosporum]
MGVVINYGGHNYYKGAPKASKEAASFTSDPSSYSTSTSVPTNLDLEIV